MRNNWSSLGCKRRLEEIARHAMKKEMHDMANDALRVAEDLLYLHGCVARGRGSDIHPEQPGRNVFEYIKKLEMSGKSLMDALQYIWDADDMGWLVGADGLYQCGQCDSSLDKDKLKIVHEDGCVQGVMASAIESWKNR